MTPIVSHGLALGITALLVLPVGVSRAGSSEATNTPVDGRVKTPLPPQIRGVTVKRVAATKVQKPQPKPNDEINPQPLPPKVFDEPLPGAAKEKM